MDYLINFCFLIFFQFISGLEYLPSTRTVEVIESSSYTIGIVETDNSTNITLCNYWSDTNISGSFVVFKEAQNETKHVESRENNEVLDYGNMGKCVIEVISVNDKGPTKWFLQPFDEKTNHTLNEAEFNVIYYYKAHLVNDPFNIQEQSSFYQYINMDKKFVNCKLRINTTEVDLELNDIAEANFNEMSIKSLGEGLCGFRGTNAPLIEDLQFRITAFDGNGLRYRALFNYRIFQNEPDNERYIKQVSPVGVSQSISCGDEHQQDFCYLFDPKNTFIPTKRSNCHHQISTTTMEDFGVWKCYVGRSRSMEMVMYSVELTYSDKPASIQTWVEESERYMSMGCQSFRGQKLDSCRMVSPNNTVFHLQPGTAYDHYLSIGTDFSQEICSIKIEKPLSESDKGQWRCEMYQKENTRFGVFIYVINTTMPSYNKHKKIVTQIGEPLDILCQVPFSSDYCYIKSPKGEQFKMNDNPESTIGFCSLTISKTTTEHVGPWRCFFAREMGVPDEEIVVEVELGEVMSYTAKVEVDSGENASLQCSSHRYPLTYCRFVSPSSTSYFIKNVDSSTRISYYGKGLEYGECGITIHGVKASDSGNWTCITEIGFNADKQETLTAVIDLYVVPTILEDPTLAIALGATAVVILISTSIAYIGVKKWQKRRSYHTTLETSASDIDESSSHDVVFNSQSTVNFNGLDTENNQQMHRT